MKTIQQISKVIMAFAFILFLSCSKDENGVPDGAKFVELPASLTTSYNGILQYNVNQTPQVTESNATATLTKTGDKVYKVTFSNNVPEIGGLRFIENNGTFDSASGSGSAEGISLRSGDLSVGITNGDKQWQFSTN